MVGLTTFACQRCYATVEFFDTVLALAPQTWSVNSLQWQWICGVVYVHALYLYMYVYIPIAAS